VPKNSIVFILKILSHILKNVEDGNIGQISGIDMGDKKDVNMNKEQRIKKKLLER
jgi:hypothetical protein